jgi:hypothetical protein
VQFREGSGTVLQQTADPLFSPSEICRETELEPNDLAWVEDRKTRRWMHSDYPFNIVFFS